MNEQRLYRRVERRERFGSRSTAVVVTLALVSLAAAYVGTEAVLSAIGRPALFVSPQQALAWAESSDGAVVISAATALVVAVVLLVVALSPGRRARHALPSERLVIVVDDAVIAGTLSRTTRLAASVPADRIRTEVSRGRAKVVITPTSGIAIDRASAARAASRAVEALGPRPRLRVSTRVAETGRVGS